MAVKKVKAKKVAVNKIVAKKKIAPKVSSKKVVSSRPGVKVASKATSLKAVSKVKKTEVKPKVVTKVTEVKKTAKKASVPVKKIVKTLTKTSGKKKVVAKIEPKKTEVKKIEIKKNENKKTVKPAPVKTLVKQEKIAKTELSKPVTKLPVTIKTKGKQQVDVDVKQKNSIKTVVEPTVSAGLKPKVAVAESANEGLRAMGISPYAAQREDDYMGPEMVEHFRHILLAYKAQLMEKVNSTVHHMQDDSANLPDLNDRATLEEEFGLELRTRDRERKLIKKIEESLMRINENEYGFCETCGVEIGVRRLEARPTATLCVDCKTIEEMKEKQRA